MASLQRAERPGREARAAARRLRLCLGVLVSLGAVVPPAAAQGQVVLSDDFARFAAPTTNLGKVPGKAWSWVKRVPTRDGKPMAELVTGRQGEVAVAYSSGNNPHDTGVAVEGFTIADAEVSLTVGPSHMPGRAHTAFLSYRARDPQAAAGGMEPGAYHLQLAPDWSGSRDVILAYGREPLAAADLAPARQPEASHRVRVLFSGNRHLVWVDDRKVIDIWELAPRRDGAGHVGFGGYYSSGPFDDFQVKTAPPRRGPEPVAGRINPLSFHGRPFFVLGAWDRPSEEDTSEFLAAGGNTAIFPAAPRGDGPERWRDVRAAMEWAARHDVAAIYQPAFDLFSREKGQATVTRAEEAPAKAKLLREMLALTAKDPQRLGYYTFDEPENAVYKAYRDWEKKQDGGLAAWMAEGLRWTYDTIKEADPAGYVMPTIAWWTTYEGLAPLYDVNLANEYPTRPDDEPLTGPLYNTVYDAAKAADAVRATGRTSFAYTPGTFDIGQGLGAWRPATLRELRYCAFGPITQGAMGVFSWRLNRCSMPYRGAVVYPVMREIHRLVPWLLGEWCNERVASDRDTATAGYLTNLPKRVRTVAGEEDAPVVEVPGVPDCSHMLRRRPTNSYLLLAVNNRKEPLAVTFTLRDIPDLPAQALEALEYRRVPIEDGRIRDTLEPFGVRAYLIDPK